MRIREQLILDIQNLSPQQVFQLYNFTEQLSKMDFYNQKWLENYNSENHPLKKFFGIISDQEALEMKALIKSEFDKIEGEW